MRPRKVNATSTQWHEFNHTLYDRQRNEGANILFCDGHAKWNKKTNIRYTWFGADPATCPFLWSGPARTAAARRPSDP